VTKIPHAAFAAALALLPGAPTWALSVYGPGAESCSDFLRYEHEHVDVEVKAAVIWTEGFLAGIGGTLESMNRKPPRGADSEAIRAFLDKYCTENPSGTVSQAAARLASDLLKEGEAPPASGPREPGE
jgi:hypothetical protein